MSALTQTERRLLLEVAFAGVNHGLQQQVRGILPALPYLVADEDTCAICRAILLVGLNEADQAREILEKVEMQETAALKLCLSLT